MRRLTTALPHLAHRIFRHPVTQNAASLFFIHIANFILPLVVVPYLARLLMPAGWGAVLFAQSFAAWLTILVEYGFLFTATRDVARSMDDKPALDSIVNAVNGAKMLLIVGTTIVTCAAFLWVPQFAENPGYLAFAWLIAVFQGLSPLWYFQGQNRMRGIALLTVALRTASTLLTFFLVRSVNDGWIVLALQAASTALTTVIAMGWMYREVPFRVPAWRAVRHALNTGKYLFVVSLSAGIYGLAGTFILGLLAPPLQVGLYGGAERIHRMFVNLFAILSQALYPYMSHSVFTDPRRSTRLIRYLFGLSATMGFALSIMTIVAAPFLVRVFLGPDFAPAVLVLQIMAVQLTVTGLSRILGVQWMLPLGMDRQFNAIVLSAGLLNLGLISLLVPSFSAVGMAIAFVLTETYVALAQVIVIQRSGYAFWSSKNRLLAGESVPSAGSYSSTAHSSN